MSNSIHITPTQSVSHTNTFHEILPNSNQAIVLSPFVIFLILFRVKEPLYLCNTFCWRSFCAPKGLTGRLHLRGGTGNYSLIELLSYLDTRHGCLLLLLSRLCLRDISRSYRLSIIMIFHTVLSFWINRTGIMTEVTTYKCTSHKFE